MAFPFPEFSFKLCNEMFSYLSTNFLAICGLRSLEQSLTKIISLNKLALNNLSTDSTKNFLHCKTEQ